MLYKRLLYTKIDAKIEAKNTSLTQKTYFKYLVLSESNLAYLRLKHISFMQVFESDEMFI